MSDMFYPTVVTDMDGQSHAVSILDYELQKNRCISISGEIDDRTALSVMAQLRYLDAAGDEPITVFISGGGGSVSAGLAIYDCMKCAVHCDIITAAVGMTERCGALLLAAGTDGRRYIAPSAEVSVYQPLVGEEAAEAEDAAMRIDHVLRTRHTLAIALAEECGMAEEQLLFDVGREKWRDAESAVEYGLADHIGYPGRSEEENIYLDDMPFSFEEPLPSPEDVAWMEEHRGALETEWMEFDAGESGMAVALLAAGNNRFMVTKTIRDHTQLTIVQANELVDALPHTFYFTDKAEGERFHEALSAAGAIVARKLS